MSAEAIVTSIELGIALVREVPKGIGRITSWVRGRRILVIGAARSGKTSFLKYLQYGLLSPEGEQTPSYGFGRKRDQDHHKTKNFVVKTGRDNMLQLHVRNAIDVVGQVPAESHAQFVRKHKPHALVIILDSSVALKGPNSLGNWLKNFSEELALILGDEAAVRRSLQTMIVVMNKADKANATQLSKRRNAVLSILKRGLGPTMPIRPQDIPVLPCILVENSEGGKLADIVIKKLALQIQERI